jgi:hypothetical protein
VIRRALAVVALVLSVAATSTPAVAQQRPSARLALASQTPWVKGSAPFGFRLDVDAVRAPQRLDLVVTVHRAVTSRSQFARTIDGELLGGSIHTDTVPFRELRFDAGGAISLTVDLPSLRVGVYPVSVALVDHQTHDDVASLVTHLVKVPSEPVTVPLSVAWVQPYGAAPALQPDGTVVLGDAALDDLRAVAGQLDSGVPLTIVPTPETVAALATIDDGHTVTELSRLLDGHQVLSTPYVDVDVSALVDAGRTGDVSMQRVAGDQVLDDALDVTTDSRTWAPTGVVTTAALRAMDGLGVRRVVLDEDALEPLESSFTRGLTLARPFSIDGTGGGRVDAVAVDPGLAAHFDEEDDVLGAHHLLADLAVLQLDAPGVARGVVVRPPDDWRPSDVFLATALAGISTSPLVKAVTVNGLFDTVDPLVDGDDEPVVRDLARRSPADLGFSPRAIDAARDAMGGLASLLVDPAADDLDVLDRLLLVAESRDLRASRRREYVESVDARIGTATSKVRVLGDRTYRLTAREGTIPVSIVNDNAFDVRVEIELTSDKLEFEDAPSAGRSVRRNLVLKAASTTTEAIPVKARTSGNFPLQVVVRSPGGGLDIGRTQITITSTVASGVGVVLSVGAALFLALWWGKHWRTVRRARRLVAAE